MPESLLNVSNVFLFGVLIEDVRFKKLDRKLPTAGKKVTVATTHKLDDLTGHLWIDGVKVKKNDTVLVKDQDDETKDGVYKVDDATTAWKRDETVADKTLVQAENGAVHGKEIWRLRQSKPGGKTLYRIKRHRAGLEEQRSGSNRFLAEQFDKARFARIYGFSYEGHYYDLPRPTVFLVHGKGHPLTEDDGAGSSASNPARAPRSPNFSGVSTANFQFADEMRVWSYDKADYTVRMDVETGMIEDVLLQVELDDEGMDAFLSGQRARVSGQRARVSGQRARVSGQRARVNNPRGD